MSAGGASLDAQLGAQLDALRRAQLLREPAPCRADLDLCSNDYLGYARDASELAQIAKEAPAAGAGASRLICGEHGEHTALERELSAWVDLPAALAFSAGYAANVGAIAALAAPGDLIVSDALNHASIIDGCRLSRARIAVVPHLDLGAVERALQEAGEAPRKLVVTESYFSMDGDSPDLARLRAVCDSFGAALYVDEAHALGVFGPEGGGLCRKASIAPDVLVGTLGKAVGLQGAFVAGSERLRLWLYNRARSFVFSTGVAPWLAAATRLRVGRVRADEAGRARLRLIAGELRAELLARGAPIARSHGPIIPWRCGSPDRALAARDRVLAAGVFVQAIRPPTVPEGTSRLRITVNARLRDHDVARATQALAALI